MGGLGGQIRGRTKEELWQKFTDEVHSVAVERFGLFPEVPADQEQAFDRMRWDPAIQQWVLDFYFTK